MHHWPVNETQFPIWPNIQRQIIRNLHRSTPFTWAERFMTSAASRFIDWSSHRIISAFFEIFWDSYLSSIWHHQYPWRAYKYIWWIELNLNVSNIFHTNTIFPSPHLNNNNKKETPTGSKFRTSTAFFRQFLVHLLLHGWPIIDSDGTSCSIGQIDLLSVDDW